MIPQDCQLTPRHKEIPAFDDMPEGFKPVLRREMEVYAGFLEWYVENRLCPHKTLLVAYMAENSTIESRHFFESLDAWRRCASD